MINIILRKYCDYMHYVGLIWSSNHWYLFRNFFFTYYKISDRTFLKCVYGSLLIPYSSFVSYHFPLPFGITRMFSISVSLFLFCIYIHLCFFLIPHISDIIQYMSFSVWLISVSNIYSKCIHIAANGRTSLFSMAK